MEKIKIFVFDTLCLGFPDSITYLKDQTFCFPAFTGKGYALFYTGNVYMMKNEYFHQGAWGEIWEVSPSVFDRINKKMDNARFTRAEITVYENEQMENPSQVHTWLMAKSLIEAKGVKSFPIRCLRDMSPALSGKPYQQKKDCC